ncbi:CpsD/CapB family tyrosine-protein kinase [Clostridium tagluense]|uniref:CpsD/CapB family tyrosine-protein kinase n=1 Tax=Clostridium tagluense TaxID=360422 RepID=UPI001CF28DC3|nr:CpsD/CapB family tyrosine-protein kinase [Clostridium tagluense]MCB2312018.1 CpsD/CapB family tyrosine-protein kinase [Clostridium tagluense]MCB2316605.1 CpsD/CapB family tyrosine-protein kinase [Clostridium tagluense]MCB2321459.1 CpsD/CapB family tyrosine-protein kinase [Clostridium tagluense]MCB2326471.1 CpsD/CapB family tyrosine-protein kinase [Clostridium tagluense]MCB2331197.1 CpsD/CapB family tyrosine-protein kinase [Clostridium tagluense]
MKGLDLITFKEPTSPMSESYRTLRTNIQFSSFDKKIKTILITSSGPGEGKTTTSSNLAMVMAQGGNKTILIDCDQRKPQVHKVFGFSNENGLSNILVNDNEVDINIGVHETEEPNLHVLSSGTRPPNPAELLGSAKMKNFIEELKKTYDFIILDTPPIVLVTDAQILAQYTDGCLLVISSGEAERDSVIKSKGLLEKVNAKILGTVLNKVDSKKKGYYHYQYEYGGTSK